jgi:hypothetical protein
MGTRMRQMERIFTDEYKSVLIRPIRIIRVSILRGKAIIALA